MLALWAEMNVIVADQFRDGNVPALQQPLAVAQRAFQSCRKASASITSEETRLVMRSN